MFLKDCLKEYWHARHIIILCLPLFPRHISFLHNCQLPAGWNGDLDPFFLLLSFLLFFVTTIQMCRMCIYTMLLYCYYWSQHHQSDHNTLPLLYWTQFQPCWFVEMWMIKASDTSIPLFLRSSPVLGGSRRQSLLSCVYIWSSFYGCVCVCVCWGACESCLRPFLIFHSPSPSLSQAPLPWLSVGV